MLVKGAHGVIFVWELKLFLSKTQHYDPLVLQEIQAFVNASHERRYGDPMTSSNVTLYYALIVAMWAVGGMLGGAVAGKLIDNMGRYGENNLTTLKARQNGRYLADDISHAFSWMTIFWLKFDWILFLVVIITLGNGLRGKRKKVISWIIDDLV